MNGSLTDYVRCFVYNILISKRVNKNKSNIWKNKITPFKNKNIT